FTAGTTAGAYRIHVTAAGVADALDVPVVNAALGAEAVALVDATQTHAPAGGSFGRLGLRVTDRYGNPVAEYSLTAVAPTGIGGVFSGGFTQVTAVTNSDGVAVLPELLTGTGVGSAYLYVTGASFLLTNDPGRAARSTPGGEGSPPAQFTVPVGQNYANFLGGYVTDAYGNRVKSASVTVTVAPAANGAGATFAGGLTSVVAPADSGGSFN